MITAANPVQLQLCICSSHYIRNPSHQQWQWGALVSSYNIYRPCGCCIWWIYYWL